MTERKRVDLERETSNELDSLLMGEANLDRELHAHYEPDTLVIPPKRIKCMLCPVFADHGFGTIEVD